MGLCGLEDLPGRLQDKHTYASSRHPYFPISCSLLSVIYVSPPDVLSQTFFLNFSPCETLKVEVPLSVSPP